MPKDFHGYIIRGEPLHALIDWGLTSPYPLLLQIQNWDLRVVPEGNNRDTVVYLCSGSMYFVYRRRDVLQLWEDLINICDTRTLWAVAVIPLQLVFPEMRDTIQQWADANNPYRGLQGEPGTGD